MTRRNFVMVGLGGITAACNKNVAVPTEPTLPYTTGPTPTQLQPLNEIINPQNGTKATLRNSGYSTADAKLTDFLRSAGYTLEVNTVGFVTAVKGVTLPYGWMFCVQNNPFGSAATAVQIKPGQLWASYEKRSLG